MIDSLPMCLYTVTVNFHMQSHLFEVVVRRPSFLHFDRREYRVVVPRVQDFVARQQSVVYEDELFRVHTQFALLVEKDEQVFLGQAEQDNWRDG